MSAKSSFCLLLKNARPLEVWLQERLGKLLKQRVDAAVGVVSYRRIDQFPLICDIKPVLFTLPF